jgi:choline transport protein
MNKSYSKGILFILCLLNSTYGFMGSDAGAHMAEEIPSPSINVPKIIVSLIFIPHITVLLRLIAEADIPYYHWTSDR